MARGYCASCVWIPDQGRLNYFGPIVTEYRFQF
jgi:hypothetical protein